MQAWSLYLIPPDGISTSMTKVFRFRARYLDIIIYRVIFSISSSQSNRSLWMPPRTEKEKMLAGEIYNCLDPDLKAERQKAKELLRFYNQTEAMPDRQTILKQLVGTIGQDSIVEPPFYCSYGKNIHIGDHVFLNYLCIILDNNEVHIGHYVMVGPNVQIYTAAHLLQAKARIQGLEETRPVVIEDNVWLGGGAILLPGVRIGRNAVVGAGAVVSRSVPENMVVAGNPARVIREIEQE